MDVLDAHIQRQILSFLVHPPPTLSDGMISQSCQAAVADSVKTCAIVCKTWRTLTNHLINHKSFPCGDIVSVDELIELKRNLDRIDLMAVRQAFMMQVRDQFGRLMLISPNGNHHVALEVVVEHTHGTSESFVERAEKFYRQFLLVKCVETLVAIRDALAQGSDKDTQKQAWLAKCCPPNFVKMFWYAHMLHPAKYVRDCHELFGQTVDHDPTYVMNSAVAGSCFTCKKDFLCHFEVETFPDSEKDFIFLGNFDMGPLAAQILVEENAAEHAERGE